MTLPPGAAYHEGIAANWTSGYAQGSFRRRLELFRALLAPAVQPGQRWLDLGCGSGVLSVELATRGACVVALDGSPSMLDEARKHLSAIDPALLTFRCANVDTLEWVEPEGFDGVVCSSLIEYLDRPQEVLAGIAACLKPGGVMIVSLPPAGSAVRTAQKLVRRLLALIGRDRFSYLDVSKTEIGRAEMTRILAQSGMTLTQTRAFDALLPDWSLALLAPSLLIYRADKRA